MLALLVAAGAHAESTLATATGATPARATAHLDFRITVLPSLGVRAADGAVLGRVADGSLAVTRNGQTTWWRPSPRGLVAVSAVPAVATGATISAP